MDFDYWSVLSKLQQNVTLTPKRIFHDIRYSFDAEVKYSHDIFELVQ